MTEDQRSDMEFSPDIYLSDNYVVLDFEVHVNDGQYGSALDKRNQLALGCWKVGGRLNARWGNELEQDALLCSIAEADFLVCHNAKYELGWLRRMGADIDSLVVFDTKTAEYVLAGNLASVDDKTGLAPLSTSLDSCCRRRGWKQKDPIVDIWMKHQIPVLDMPSRWVEGRCRRDVEDTERLFLSQRKSLLRTSRLPVLYTRCLLTPVITQIEAEGICLDPSRVETTYAEYSRMLQQLDQQMTELTGGINWRSAKQSAEFIYDTLGFEELTDRRGFPKRTTSGGRATDQKTLQALVAKTEAQREFVGLRRHIGRVAAALSKNLEYFKHACEKENGVFRAQFNQTVTATHRLSSSGLPSDAGSVQFQNLPRAFKPLFRAREGGWRIMEVDGAQIEFRVAAFLGNDQQAMADILDPKFDAHLTTASYMTERPYDELRAAYLAGDKKADAARTAAKAETFKPLYGGNKGTAAQERWYKGFRERYHELAEVQESWVAEVRQQKRLVTPWGLRYYWPRAKVSNSGYCNVTASVYNYPIQALATAEIIPVALVCLWRGTRHLRDSGKLRIVNTVHDSVVMEFHPDVQDELREIAIDSFTTKVYDYLHSIYGLDFGVPLGVGVKVADHWGEGKEESYNVFKDGRRVKIK